MTIIFCMTIKCMFMHKEKLNCLTPCFNCKLCRHMYKSLQQTQCAKTWKADEVSWYPSWKYRKNPYQYLAPSQDLDTHLYPFLGDGGKILRGCKIMIHIFFNIFKGGIKILRRCNILICATLKTYLLCFPKYGPLAASCRASVKIVICNLLVFLANWRKKILVEKKLLVVTAKIFFNYK